MNAVTCLHCGRFIASLARHNFQSCSCPEEKRISVDGGSAYQRRVFGRLAKWQEDDTGEVIDAAAKQVVLRVQKGMLVELL